jgi:hypothetical protein
MSYFITKEHLRLQRSDTRNFSAVINESRQARVSDSARDGVTVFLSHKHDEVEVLENVISLLKCCGVNVYVDWMDEGMPKTTSGLTAVKLKQKITACKKFVFLGTEGAIASKWCNWELGLGDAKKYPANIAIIPIVDASSNYSGSEYLQIYPVIKMLYKSVKGDYVVEWGGKSEPLADWLKR